MKKYDNLSDNFKYYEFFSGDRKLGKNSIEPPMKYFDYIATLADQLQNVRDKIETPIIITSAWRTPEHNKTIGGAKYSYHLRGLAVDSKAVGISLFEYFSYILRYTKFQGFGYYGSSYNKYKGFIHSDLRNLFTIFRY